MPLTDSRQLRNVRFQLPEPLKVKNVTVMIDTICQFLTICNASAQQSKSENFICLRLTLKKIFPITRVSRVITAFGKPKIYSCKRNIKLLYTLADIEA